MPATRRPRPPVDEPPVDERQQEIPEPEKRSRSNKNLKLQQSIEGIYTMIGGAIVTLPPSLVGTRFQPFGVNLAKSSDVIAEAWVDLAEDDPRVRKAWESLTSMSGWSRVIGLHLLAFSGAMPAVVAAQQPTPQEPQGNGNAGDMDLQMMMGLADLLRQAQSAERAEPQQQAPPPPVPPVQAEPIEQQPRVRTAPTAFRPGRGAGIPDPATLLGGAVGFGDIGDEFPTSGSENVNK